MNVDDAITYAERHTLHALSIEVDGTRVAERMGAGWDVARAHPLYSGTKSFWGVAAGAAWDDGLLTLDEPVASTLGEWRADPQKWSMTIRQLLTLTSGFGFGGLGNAVPTAQRALETPLKNDPGTVFTYGGVPLQVFGEVLRRKVAPAFPSAHAFLQARVLDRIGMTVDHWRVLRDGTHPLPTGAFVSATEWLKFGRLLLAGGAGVISAAAFAACVHGSDSNPLYGLGLWLRPPPDRPAAVYASGAGGQGLYVLPKQRLLAVHFGQSTGWNHAAFIRRLATGTAPS